MPGEMPLEMNDPNPELEAEIPGWEPVLPYSGKTPPESFLTGDPQSPRVRVRYFRRKEDGGLGGRVWFGPFAQGQKDLVHGGAIAAFFDEAMGAACWLTGVWVVTARLTTHYRKKIPLGMVLEFTVKVERVENRKVFAHGELRAEDTLFAEADALFIKIPKTEIPTA